MAMNASDISIAANGDIRWEGLTTTFNTVLEFHRLLMDKADDAVASGDDLMDITFPEPSDRSTDNIITLLSPYNIDDAMAQQLYDGSITQDNGDTLYSGLEVKGVVVSGTQLVILQNNSVITSWWADGSDMINKDATNLIILRTLIKSRADGVNIDGRKILLTSREFNDAYAEFPVTLGLGNSTGAISTEDDLNNNTSQVTVAAWPCTNIEGYQTIDLNNGNGAQPYYSQWNKDAQSINELYEFTKNIGRRGTAETIHSMGGALFRGITHQWDYNNGAGSFTEDGIVAWGTSFNFTSGVGEFTVGMPVTFATSGATGQVRYSTGAGATGTLVVAVDAGSGTVTSAEQVQNIGVTVTADVGTVSDPTALGGTAAVLADDDADTLWVQLLTGSAPTTGSPVYEQGSVVTVTHDVNGSPTSRSVRPVFLGQSTGLAIIGAFGIGVEAADLLTSDKMTDLLAAPQSPPNNQQWTASGAVNTEDRIIVALNDGSDEIDYTQFTTNGILTGATTSIVVNEAIPTWLPQTGGTIRVKDNAGIFIRCPVESYNTGTKTFTVTSTDFTTQADSGNNAFGCGLDLIATGTEHSFTGIYTGDISLVVKSRDGGVTPEKPFRVPSTFNSGGGGTIIQHVSDI